MTTSWLAQMQESQAAPVQLEIGTEMSGHQVAQDDQVECRFEVGFDDLGFAQVVVALPLEAGRMPLVVECYHSLKPVDFKNAAEMGSSHSPPLFCLSWELSLHNEGQSCLRLLSKSNR